ncbi:MAG: response regulator [Anaerolineales bacterium]|jgi:pilus assembly protein CpaE|uniref:response regulator n=1 Tax=Candidatus Villigracilis proximus TaxID=3140683 RepID=UPI003135ED06|nr:response regulator [Anaerolineales bacterium]MBK8821341.1 response regulator [Anaerolineales bacterium]MBK9209477.1 response regulator [Anaerolineales bacterium]
MSADKIRVLIVDDIAETRENVRKLLQFESDVDVAGAAGSGKEGIQLAQELDPDVVLMDINMPDIDGITATEIIRQKQPHIQVIILSVQNDQNYMRRAMLAGARDFLTKPPMGDELISAVRRAGEMARAERAKGAQQRLVATSASGSSAAMANFTPISKGKIVTVYSPKGGTGCTTIAVNLALALNSEDTRTVLVDANLQFGDVAVFVNEQGKNTILELAPRVDELEPDIVEEILIKHEASGMRILPAPQRPEMAEKVNADQFSKVLQYLQRMYAYVVIDTSPILSDVILSTIDISDVLVLVTTQEIPSIKNARLFLDLLHTLGIGKERIIFTMNRYDKRIAITPERVSDNLKQEIVTTIPLDEKVVITAVNRGVPFMLDNKSQPVGRGILSLAESVRTRLAALEDKDEPLVRR